MSVDVAGLGYRSYLDRNRVWTREQLKCSPASISALCLFLSLPESAGSPYLSVSHQRRRGTNSNLECVVVCVTAIMQPGCNNKLFMCDYVPLNINASMHVLGTYSGVLMR